MTAAPGPQQPDEVPMRYPAGRPSWLGRYQPATCDRCLTEQDADERHPCPSVVCPEHGVEHHPDRAAAPSAQPDEASREWTSERVERFAQAAYRNGYRDGQRAAQPVRDTGEGRAADVQRHRDAVADTGTAWRVDRRRPWVLGCLWCDFTSGRHRTRGDALVELDQHYADLVPGWGVVAHRNER